jgi:hypothetical protein
MSIHATNYVQHYQKMVIGGALSAAVRRFILMRCWNIYQLQFLNRTVDDKYLNYHKQF